MTTWLAIGLCVAVLGFGVIAGNVDVDFPENVNSRFGGSRIVSGWEAEPGQVPYQVGIRMINPIGQVSACGGSVIHPEWVMTAAHCTAGRINFVVRAGVVNLTTPEYIFEASQWYNHPLYNNNQAGVVQPNDIGLLKLDRVLTLSRNLQTIRLQPSMDMNRNYDAERLVASGYGLTWTQGTSPENLNWVYLLGTSNFDCWVAFGFSNIIVDSTICAAGYNVSSQSTCQGDSGGPLTVVEQDGKRSMVGVASFVSGGGCHTPAPAGFIRPGHYHDWFYEITGINFDWNWDESSEEEPAPSSESSEEEPAPSSESSEEEPAPSSESSEEEPAPSSESSEEEPAQSSESSEEEPAPSSESSEEETEPPSESSEEENPPTPEPSEEESEPPSESSEEDSVPHSESSEEGSGWLLSEELTDVNSWSWIGTSDRI